MGTPNFIAQLRLCLLLLDPLPIKEIPFPSLHTSSNLFNPISSLGGRLTDAEGNDIDFKNKWDYKHETGLIAAKYDQPGYVAAIKYLSTLED